MDKFDKLIKEAVESYEAPYDAQVWANVSGQLGSKGGAWKWVGGSAAAVVLIAGGIYLAQDNNTVTEQNVAENTVTGDQHTTTQPLNGVETINTNTGESTQTVDAGQDHSSNLAVSNPSHSNQSSENGSEQTGVSGNTPTNGSESNNTSNNGGTTPENGSSSNSTTQNGSNGEEPAYTARINSRFNTTDAVACMNTEFIFTPEDNNQPLSYVWDFGDGSFSSSKVATHTYKRSGTFTVSLSLKDPRTNKTLGKSSMDVTVNPLPVVDFAYEKNNEMIPTVTFINLTEDATTWNWDIKGLKTSTETQFEYTFRKKGIYTVELTATNEFGCSENTQKPIEVKSDYNLLAPTAFTPNGDNKNDYFIPEALRLMNVNFTMVVYDKAGSIMFQTNNVNNPWDGTNINNNSLADDGAYVWQVQFKNANGETEYYEGQVIITR